MSKAKAVELKQKLQKLPKNWVDNENRVLIRQGILMIEEDNKLKPRWCFLFNDCFLETKPACDFADNNTKLSDPSTPFRFKNYIMLNTCYIEENPNVISKTAKEQHSTKPFLLIGHNLETPLKNKKTEINLIYSSTKELNERELWLSDIHQSICKIYQSINNDMMNYGWQNQYRKGTIFHAIYTLHNELLKDPEFKDIVNTQINENLKDIGGHSLLHIACAVNNVDFIEDYGNKFNIDDTDCNGWSSLRIACDNDNIESVQAIVEDLYPNFDEYYPEDKSMNPTKPTKEFNIDDRTILHELCVRGQAELVKILLNSDQINMEALDKNGNTPLHVAAKRNNEECVVLMLQNGAPPNLADFKGNRALHHTTKEAVARWLVAYGARLELSNQFKKTCQAAWSTKLDKYLPFLQQLNATDCKIQDRITENTAWFDDKLSNACLLCGNNFTVWSRRHHCRACGLLVCQPCSLRKLQFNKDGKPSLERACDKCFNKNHSKFLRKKKYTFKNKQYTMTPREFYKMEIMETTMPGAYHTYIKNLEEQKNNDEDDILNIADNSDETKNNEEKKQ